MSSDATIFALSSGPPPAAIAVVRISGASSGAVLHALTQRELPSPRRAVTRKLIDQTNGRLLDQALVLWLPGPDTVTGEDLVELHLHGGRAVVNAVLRALIGMKGLTAADAGAFTRRAFDNGRLDLSQVEGLADLLAAETEGQRRNALAMSEGSISTRAAAWRHELLGLAAVTEAQLDFADEDDVDTILDHTRFDTLIDDIAHWVDAPPVERLRDGIRLVIGGPPNAGKSTLLNALAGRSVAITAPIAGTTRDIVEATVAIDGVPFVLTDTAGLHSDTADIVEIEGIRRARAALDTADIILWLGNPDQCPASDRALLVAARCDEGEQPTPQRSEIWPISAHTGQGMPALRAEVLRRARALLPVGDTIAINRRQRALVVELLDEVRLANANRDLLIQAEHLRRGQVALDRLVGRVGVEDMLDALFGSMCIGK